MCNLNTIPRFARKSSTAPIETTNHTGEKKHKSCHLNKIADSRDSHHGTYQRRFTQTDMRLAIRHVHFSL
jgi:hypothetical protein